MQKPTSAVVPASVENHYLSSGWKVLHVPLDIHFGLFSVRRSGKHYQAENTGTRAFCDGANRAALAGSTSFEDDNRSKPFVFDPRLKLAKLPWSRSISFSYCLRFSVPVSSSFFSSNVSLYPSGSSRTARPWTFTDSVAGEKLGRRQIPQEWARVMTSFLFSVGSL